KGPIGCPHDTFEQVIGGVAGDGDVARLERQSELFDEREVGGVEGADDLAAELDWAAAADVDLLDTPADAIARLESDHVGARRGEIARGDETGEAGAEDNDVDHSASSRSRQPSSSSRASSRPSNPR